MKTKILFTTLLTMCTALTACNDTPRTAASDPEATPQTATLLTRLRTLAPRGTMAGHQDALAYGIGWYDTAERCDFRDACGAYPALFGWEIGELELGGDLSLDSVRFDRIRNYVKRVYALGGVNTISWHARNPLTGGDAWDVSSAETVRSILPGGAKNALYEEWLDRLAAFFKSLKSDDGTPVPVIFRPFHELTGSWFWWGRDLCTPDEYVALWRHTAEGLRTRGVHNLLWAYSAAGYASADELEERYPGDEWVDIVGFDAYDMNDGSYADDVRARIALLRSFAAAHDKLPALTETGSEGLKNPAWFTEVLAPLLRGQGLSYVMFWRNAWNIPGHFYAAWPGHPAAADLTRFVGMEEILTLGETGPLYE